MYDENELYRYHIGYIIDYLFTENITKFKKMTNFTASNMENLYLKLQQKNNDTQNLMIVIDRRKLYRNKNKNDMVYMIKDKNMHRLPLSESYCIGFEFNIIYNDDGSNKVTSYLLYGINERQRFYPEMMTTIIPRLFKKPTNMTQYEYLTKLYDHSFKHGWCVDLEDKIFNKYYKIITNHQHISVNYNRDIIHNPNYKNINIDSLTDFIFAKLSKNKRTKKMEIKYFQRWLNVNNYDSETIECDILNIDSLTDFIFIKLSENKYINSFKCWLTENNYDSETIEYDIFYLCKDEQQKTTTNIEDYIISSESSLNISKIKEIINDYKKHRFVKYVENKNKFEEQYKCTINNVSQIDKCGYIINIIDALKLYEKYKKYNNSNINIYDIKCKNIFNTELILKSYDHIIRCHDFVFEKTKITQYVIRKIGGSCKLKYKCNALLAYINRKRENIKNKKHGVSKTNDKNDDIVILCGALNSLHSYI